MMHSLPPMTIFWSRVSWFANDFHEWRIYKWKSLANRITSDKKIAIHGNKCITLFLTCHSMPWTHNSEKKNRSLCISPLSPRMILAWIRIVTPPQFISDVTRTRGIVMSYSSIVTSYSSIVLARANWHKGGLHYPVFSCVRNTFFAKMKSDQHL